MGFGVWGLGFSRRFVMNLDRFRLLTNGCLLVALSAIAPEALQPPAVRYFWSNGRQVPVAVVPNAVAIEASAGAIRTGDTRLLQALGSQDPSEVARAASLTASGISIVKARSGRTPQLRAALRASGRIRELGVAVDVGPPTRTRRPYVVLTPEFIVRFKPDVSRATIDEINRRLGAVIVREGPFVQNQFVLRVADGSAGRALELSDQYFKLPEVDGLAHPNFIYPRETRSDPNDPLWPQQWHLMAIDVPAAWQVTQGDGVIVAVIDLEGVEIKHEDLFPNRFVNTKEIPDNNKDDDNNSMVDDVTGWNFRSRSNDPKLLLPHGTAAAAVAVAACDNALGGCGVAPKARLLPIAQGLTVQDDADAFRYAMRMGASVISNSWGYSIGLPTTQVVEEAVAEVMTQGRSGLGTAVVFAMTNEKRDNFGGGPDGYRDIASIPGVLAIGRSTDADVWGQSGFGKGMALLAPTSAARGDANRGCLPESLLGKKEIVTADLMGPAGYNAGTPKPCFCNATAAEVENQHYTGCFQGTSAATPLVAGVVALMIGANPKITVSAIRDILAETAERIEPAIAAYKPDDRKRLYSFTHGWGRVHAGRAVTAAAAWMPPTAPPPAPSPGLPSPRSNPPAIGQGGDMKVAGKQSAEVRVPSGTGSQAAYVWEGATALVIAPGVSTAAVLSALEGTAKPVSGFPWTQDLMNRNVLVIESTDAGSAQRIADLHTRGLVEGTGRVAFFDKAGKNVAVLLNRFSIAPNDGVRESELAAEAARDGFTLQARPDGRYLLTPKAPMRDALEVASRAEQFAKSPLVRQNSLLLEWIAPVQRR